MAPTSALMRNSVVAASLIALVFWWTNSQSSHPISAFPSGSSPKIAFSQHPAQIAFIPSERVRLPVPGGSLSPARVSRASCVAQDSSILNRVCRYENVCYSSPHGVSYHMGANAAPLQQNVYPPYAIPVRFSTRDTVWAPNFVSTNIPRSHKRASRPVTLLHHWAHENLGHILWEDLGGIYQGLRVAGLERGEFDVVAIDSECSAYGCELLAEVAQALGARFYRGWEQWAKETASDICFDLALGGPNSVFQNDAPSSDRLSGREPLLLEVLTRIISHYSLPWQLPPKHRIIITHKSDSMFARNPEGRHRAIANHDQVAEWLREAYPGVQVDIIEWQNLSFLENLEELGKTSVLITPCGGVSMLVPFLPPGAHAIVMDYMKTTQDPFGGAIGESRHMDYNIWEHFHHLRIDYYTIQDKTDFIWDFEGATDARSDSSIMIKKDRILAMVSLHKLLDGARNLARYLLRSKRETSAAQADTIRYKQRSKTWPAERYLLLSRRQVDSLLT